MIIWPYEFQMILLLNLCIKKLYLESLKFFGKNVLPVRNGVKKLNINQLHWQTVEEMHLNVRSIV